MNKFIPKSFLIPKQKFKNGENFYSFTSLLMSSPTNPDVHKAIYNC